MVAAAAAPIVQTAPKPNPSQHPFTSISEFLSFPPSCPGGPWPPPSTPSSSSPSPLSSHEFRPAAPVRGFPQLASWVADGASNSQSDGVHVAATSISLIPLTNSSPGFFWATSSAPTGTGGARGGLPSGAGKAPSPRSSQSSKASISVKVAEGGGVGRGNCIMKQWKQHPGGNIGGCHCGSRSGVAGTPPWTSAAVVLCVFFVHRELFLRKRRPQTGVAVGIGDHCSSRRRKTGVDSSVPWCTAPRQ